jgi:hypothetical protein
MHFLAMKKRIIINIIEFFYLKLIHDEEKNIKKENEDTNNNLTSAFNPRLGKSGMNQYFFFKYKFQAQSHTCI